VQHGGDPVGAFPRNMEMPPAVRAAPGRLAVGSDQTNDRILIFIDRRRTRC
jgi:hypothetical protein